jgi:hypothetical protein
MYKQRYSYTRTYCSATIQTYSQAGRKAGRQKGGRAERQAGKIGRQEGGRAERQAGKLAGRQEGGRAQRQADRHTDIQTETDEKYT